MATTDTYEFRDLSGLVRALKASLALYVLIAAVGLWSGWSEIQLIEHAASGGFVSEAEAEANDSRQGAIGIVQTLVFFTTVFLFVRWTYLSSKNARALGATGMRFSPGWSVGWYFVPIFTFWKPYQAMKEIFQASHPGHGEDWRQAPRPGLMPIWWTLWVIGNLLGQAILKKVLSAETIEELLATSWLIFASDALDIPLGLVVIALVAQLHDWQSSKLARVRRNGFVPEQGRPADADVSRG